eukprot:12917534-Prorocentrum_lima.AAC.1
MITIDYVPSQENPAYALTKGLMEELDQSYHRFPHPSAKGNVHAEYAEFNILTVMSLVVQDGSR